MVHSLWPPGLLRHLSQTNQKMNEEKPRRCAVRGGLAYSCLSDASKLASSTPTLLNAVENASKGRVLMLR